MDVNVYAFIKRRGILRILIINEYVKKRGAEQIVADQKKLFSQYNNNVQCLCFDIGYANNVPEGYDIIHISQKSKLVFDFFVYCKLRRYIVAYNPEIIIVHNIFSSPTTVYRALNGFKTIQVIHDYKIVCPTSWCVHKNMPHTICEGYKCKKCIKLCSNINSRLKVMVNLWLVRKCEKLRKKYIKVCISPSERLNKYLLDYGYKSVCINNPFQTDLKTEKYTRNSNELRLIYAGAVTQEKGVLEFCNAIINNYKNITLDIYGKIADDCTEEVKKIIGCSNKRIKFCGHINHEELITKYGEYDYLIVPSIWMDNYPTAILEAMGCGIVVIGTNRGGIPEMLAEGRGFIYKYGDNKDLYNICDMLFRLSEEDYNTLRKRANKYVYENNSFDNYYKQIDDLMKQL